MTSNGHSDSFELNSQSSNHERNHPSPQIILCHFNCRKCHHHHTAKPIEIPPDDTHLRVDCDKCLFSQFGIGRSSIKSYLASVDTLSSSEEGPTASSTVCTNGTGANPSPGEPSRSLEGTPAIVIAGLPGENNTQVPSSTPRKDSSLNSDAVVPRRNVHEESAHVREIDRLPREGASSQTLPRNNPILGALHGASFPSKSTTRYKSKLKKILGYFKRPQWRRLRYWNSRAGTSSTLNGLPDVQSRGPGDTGHGSQIETEQEPRDPLPGPITSTFRRPQAEENPTVGLEPLTQNAPMTSNVGENRATEVTSPSDHVAGPDETPEGIWNPAAEKAERFRIKRRGLTLRKQKLRAGTTCRCGEDCHCMGKPGESTTPRSLDSRIVAGIPDSPFLSLQLGNSQNPETGSAAVPAGETTNLDRPHVHFDQPIYAESPLIPDLNHSARPASRLSMTGTTLTESSSSGARSARSLVQRANSLPVSRFGHFSQTLEELRRYATGARPDAMRALTDFAAIYESQHSSSVPDLAPHRESERTDSIDFATDDHPGGQPGFDTETLANLVVEDTHGRATSLSRLPEPDDEQQTEEPRENGETERSSTRISLGSGSDDGSNGTARLRNPGQMPTASSQSGTQHDEISDALEQMSSETPGGPAEHTTESTTE